MPEKKGRRKITEENKGWEKRRCQRKKKSGKMLEKKNKEERKNTK